MTKAIAIVAAAFLFVPGIASAQTFSAILNGGQETPPVETPATGTGSFSLSAEKILSYNISFSGLLGSETVAHIHCCALMGSPAGPLFNLPAGSPKVGTVGPLTPQQEVDLLSGKMYVNIHSSAHSGGEIRGQILATVPVEKHTWSLVKRLYQE